MTSKGRNLTGCNGRSVAAAEPQLAAAVGELNATIRAAFDKLVGLTADYHRSRDEFDSLHAEVAAAMMDFAGASGEEGEERPGFFGWMEAWMEAMPEPMMFEHPRTLVVPSPSRSALIAGLPREPAAVEVAAPPAAAPPAESATSAVSQRYFEFTSGTSNKFWEESRAGDTISTRFGKIGTGGQSKTKAFASPEVAAAEMAKNIAKQVKEGYIEQGREPARESKSAGTALLSADPETLLGAVLPTATDRQRRLFAVACCRQVADWLIIDHALEGRDDDYREAIAAAERFADGRRAGQRLWGRRRLGLLQLSVP